MRISIELRRPALSRRLAVILALVVLAVPAAVVASHQFSDVPDASTFHDDVSAVTEAGIASGVGGGLYKPADPVTRGQMAAFLHRAIGRAGVNQNLANLPTGGAETLLGSASLKLIGPSGGYQGVLIQAAMQLDVDLAVAANCVANLTLKKAGTTVVDTWTVEFYPDAAHEESVMATFYTTQPSGSTVTYGLYGTNFCSQSMFTDEDLLIVQNIPLAGDATGVSPASITSLEAEREE
jgi:hypothetical protein